ncbi:MAG: methionyl-tRNA formyltransferase [Candidatus Omnitrophica bacterium]|nr:methionyl-tRNA formyltransferase [Candidatus Omnitrophota bacterium]MBU1869525.1 methionyl-tRNA formyltransferase [Candidatus Omnitrophota bacterium]
MNIIFFGSSQFSIPSLRAILDAGYKVPCVVTQPDRKKGRHLHLASTAVKEAAKASGLCIFQPESVNSKESESFLKSLGPDLFVVVAYGQILSQEVLDIPKIMPINAHASLLPKYRGAAPISWAIIKGEKKSGVSIIKITKQMDSGPLFLSKEVLIKDSDTELTLEESLSGLSAQLLVQTIKKLENNDYRLCEQDEKLVSFAPKLKKKDGLIKWGLSAIEINDLVRGCISWPGAYTYYQGKMVKIYSSLVRSLGDEAASQTAGTTLEVSKNAIAVTTGKDILVIKELQPEGKRRMTVAEFIAGHKIKCGEKLG